MVPAIIPKVVRLVPMLGSPVDSEALGAARAIGRVLAANHCDFHDFARQIERQPEAVLPPPRRERRDRAPRTPSLSAESVRLLREGLRLDVFTAWEIGFADTILTAAGRRSWRPSRRQTDIIARLVSKAQEAEAHV